MALSDSISPHSVPSAAVPVFQTVTEGTASKVIKVVAFLGLLAGLGVGGAVSGLSFQAHHSYAFMKTWEFLLPGSVALAALVTLIVSYAKTPTKQFLISNVKVTYTEEQSALDESGMILKINGKKTTLVELKSKLGSQEYLAACASQTILNEGCKLATEKWFTSQGAVLSGVKNQFPEFDFRTGFFSDAVETVVVTKTFAVVESSDPEHRRGFVKMTATIQASDPARPTFSFTQVKA